MVFPFLLKLKRLATEPNHPWFEHGGDFIGANKEYKDQLMEP
ncbi:MAG: hypothetical protein ACKOF9_07465 [Burkholderiales bacterium]